MDTKQINMIRFTSDTLVDSKVSLKDLKTFKDLILGSVSSGFIKDINALREAIDLAINQREQELKKIDYMDLLEIVNYTKIFEKMEKEFYIELDNYRWNAWEIVLANSDLLFNIIEEHSSIRELVEGDYSLNDVEEYFNERLLDDINEFSDFLRSIEKIEIIEKLEIENEVLEVIRK